MSYQAMYAGEKINLEEGVPELKTIGVSLARLVRFTGNQEGVYTVLPHSLVVAALMPPGESIYGLMHDAHESVTADVPRPMKCAGHAEVEDIISARIYAAYGVPPTPAAVMKRLKRADNAALVAEAYVVGYSDPMYDWFEEEELIPDQEALRLTRRYVQDVERWMFTPELSGPLFERKFKQYFAEAGLMKGVKGLAKASA